MRAARPALVTGDSSLLPPTVLCCCLLLPSTTFPFCHYHHSRRSSARRPCSLTLFSAALYFMQITGRAHPLPAATSLSCLVFRLLRRHRLRLFLVTDNRGVLLGRARLVRGGNDQSSPSGPVRGTRHWEARRARNRWRTTQSPSEEAHKVKKTQKGCWGDELRSRGTQIAFQFAE